jgi:hypothetical protein
MATTNLGAGQSNQFSPAAQAQDLSHPPGYVQNPYAADLTPSQRAATEAQAGGSSNSAGGILGSAGPNDNAGFGEEDGVWGTVKQYAVAAGAKVKEAEQEVWRRIEGEK